MMTFQQACSYVRATGASAYCYTPWVRDGEWIGLQHCILYERACAAGVNAGNWPSGGSMISDVRLSHSRSAIQNWL